MSKQANCATKGVRRKEVWQKLVCHNYCFCCSLACSRYPCV